MVLGMGTSQRWSDGGNLHCAVFTGDCGETYCGGEGSIGETLGEEVNCCHLHALS